ncbi:MAG TPA: hypothetical protein VJJ20_00020 [Candidatus Paceibacterota bacterium]
MIPKEPLFSKLEPYIVPAIVVLVGVGAFGLGRLSAAPGHPALRVLYPGAELATPVAAGVGELTKAVPSSAKATQGLGAYVASKNGSKYYLTTCPSAGRIKDENKVYFGSAAEALAAGYTAAANCPGL